MYASHWPPTKNIEKDVILLAQVAYICLSSDPKARPAILLEFSQLFMTGYHPMYPNQLTLELHQFTARKGNKSYTVWSIN